MFFTNKKILHHLNDVSLVAVATKQIEETIDAMEYSSKKIMYRERLLLSSEIKKKVKNITHIPIKPFSNIEDWGYFIVYELHKFIKTKYILLIHADGFVVNPEKWSDEFLKYDYIGAPWPRHDSPLINRDQMGRLVRVGNSVSLRSKRILELPTKIKAPWPNGRASHVHEDAFLCIELRADLEKEGIKYAPFSLACRFSRETSLPENKDIEPFVFHKWNDQNKKYPFNPEKKINRVLKRIKNTLRLFKKARYN